VVVGILPAVHAARTDVTTAMREGSAGSGRGVAGRRARSALVVAELALALVLLVGSALLIQSFARLRAVNPGFDAATLLVVPLDPPEARYDTPDEILTLYERVRDEIAALPGVRSAAIINHFPMSGAGITTPLEVPGRVSRPGEDLTAIYRLVDDRYFGTIGQRVARGRGFTAADMTPASTSLVVGESLANRLWPGQDPIGQRLTVFRQLSASPLYRQPVAGEVVGVVADVKFRTLDEPEPMATVYVPLPVEPWRRAFVGVRAAGDPAVLSAAARRVVTAADADLPVAEITTVNALMDTRLTERRFTMTVLSAFAASALGLAIIGVYGIVAYGVAQRTREIGIRAALGAQRTTLVGLFVREGIVLAAIGLAAGLALSLAGARLLESMVFGVAVRDAGTYLLTGVLLLLIAAVASFIPARRAAGVDPVEALRGE
jgi:predicted permease